MSFCDRQLQSEVENYVITKLEIKYQLENLNRRLFFSATVGVLAQVKLVMQLKLKTQNMKSSF